MKELKQICQVLLFLSERDDWVPRSVIENNLIDIAPKAIRDSLRQLVIKQKIQKQKRTGELSEYKYIDALVKPSPRPRTVKCKSPVSRAIIAKAPHVVSNFFRFSEQKINLLERLKNKVSDTDRDLIIGMINDYSQTIKRIRK